MSFENLDLYVLKVCVIRVCCISRIYKEGTAEEEEIDEEFNCRVQKKLSNLSVEEKLKVQKEYEWTYKGKKGVPQKFLCNLVMLLLSS
jgi:hypothetical protein